MVGFTLIAGLPEPVDGVVTIDASTEVTAADQAVLNGLTSLVIAIQGKAAAPALYAAADNVVTIPCPVKITTGNTTYVGKADTGTLVFENDISFDPGNKELGLCGDVRLNGGSSLGANGAISTLGTGDNADSTVVTFGRVFTKAAVTAYQTRGKTTFRFATDNVFGTKGSPLFILGRTSNPSGILDLDGHDQSVGRFSFFKGNSEGNIRKYNPALCISSEDAATLTVREGFVSGKSLGDSDIFNGRFLGGVSFKLDSANGAGVASFSNTVIDATEYCSTTTGALISASGTIRLLEGCRFASLSELRKEGTGSFEISSAALGDSVVATLVGTGKITLNVDLAVLRAQVWNESKGAFDYLEPDCYDASNLSGHLAGPGRLRVRKGAPLDRIPLVTNDHWIAENARTYVGELPRTGTWTGPGGVSDGAIAFDATDDAPFSFVPFRKPRADTIREIGLNLSFGAPAGNDDLKAVSDRGAQYGIAVVAVDDVLRYVTLLNGVWVTNITAEATLDGSDRIVCRIDGIENEIVYTVRATDGSEIRLASAERKQPPFSGVYFTGEGRLDDMRGVYYRNALLVPGFLLYLK